MASYLTKTEIAQILSDQGLGGKRQIMNVLDGLVDLAEDELSAGNDFAIPGIVKIGYSYSPPKKKGERWTKGQEVVGIGGVSSLKDSDSPPMKAKIKLRPSLLGRVGRLRIRNDEMSKFLQTKAGKAVIARKSK